MLADQLEAGDWFRDTEETQMWYVDDVQEHGDNVHVFYSKSPDDLDELSEAIYDRSAVVFVEHELEVD